MATELQNVRILPSFDDIARKLHAIGIKQFYYPTRGDRNLARLGEAEWKTDLVDKPSGLVVVDVYPKSVRQAAELNALCRKEGWLRKNVVLYFRPDPTDAESEWLDEWIVQHPDCGVAEILEEGFESGPTELGLAVSHHCGAAQ